MGSVNHSQIDGENYHENFHYYHYFTITTFVIVSYYYVYDPPIIFPLYSDYIPIIFPYSHLIMDGLWPGFKHVVVS